MDPLLGRDRRGAGGAGCGGTRPRRLRAPAEPVPAGAAAGTSSSAHRAGRHRSRGSGPVARRPHHGVGRPPRGRARRGGPPLLGGGVGHRRQARDDPLRRVGHARRRRPARGRGGGRRWERRLPHPRTLPLALRARVRRRDQIEPNGPCARRARPRELAPPRREQRGDDGVLRPPVRRRPGPPPRPLGGHGPADDAPAAGGERTPRAAAARTYIVSEDCRDDGPLDLDPRSSRFP